jgi:chromosome segregation ATPase
VNTIRAVLVGAALLAAGWLGWHFGSGELKKAKEELAAIEKSGKEAQALQAKAQDKLKGDLVSLAKRHEDELATLNRGFDKQKQDLSGELANTRSQLAKTSAGRKATETELAAVREKIALAPPGVEREKLVEKEVQLVQIDRKLGRDELGLMCVDASVPPNLLPSLAIGAKP